MASQPSLKLYNTLTRQKEVFEPIDSKNVRMYVCGPTVYDFAHIGNARPVIVFDVLYRLLRHLYGNDHVTYVRNITDVDDKINARALRDFGSEIAAGNMTLNEAIRHVTEKTADQFHADVKALGCLEPDVEPRATEFVLPRADGKADMVSLIQSLLDKEHAYVAQGKEGREVLFDVTSMKDYGALSNRKLDEQQAGARIAVESHKKNPGDFVLWKESDQDQPGWDASFKSDGKEIVIHGRPGWHIECSAMSAAYLGDTFDIHGGGLDLIFPHHENEIAQSCCAHQTEKMANVWMHNGYLQVEGKKMSKSEGNFVTIHDLLVREPGDAIRWLMLKTHYRTPLDFRQIGIRTAASEIRDLIEKAYVLPMSRQKISEHVDTEFLRVLADDLNTPAAISHMHTLAKSGDERSRMRLRWCLEFFGIRHLDEPSAYLSAVATYARVPDDVLFAATHWKQSILNGLKKDAAHYLEMAEGLGWSFANAAGGVDFLELKSGKFASEGIEDAISQRLAFIADKNWAEADRIRDELLAQGIQLKDSKDSETGERITTWEVKR